MAPGERALAASTLVRLVVLLPLQFRLDRETEPAVLRRLFWRWSVVGWADTALLVFAIWRMTTKG